VDELRNDFETGAQFTKLIDFDIYFFERMMKYMEINLQPKMASNISEYDTFPDQFVENIGADTLFLEYESKNYQRQTDLAIPALDNHPKYRQAVPGFVPDCSMLDLLMNYGKESFKVIDDLRE
jgi:hypothetical protein